MPARSSTAKWEGKLKDGKGSMKIGNGIWEGPFSFVSRFESGTDTNPEELIAAAHAGCYSMAFSATLEKNGFDPKSVATTATAHLEKVGDGFAITKIELDMAAEIPGIDDAKFNELAEAAKNGCPVSKALAGAEISLKAKLN